MVKTFLNDPIWENRSKEREKYKYGDVDTFKLICRDWSYYGGIEETRAMEIPSIGCVIKATIKQGKDVSEVLTFVPNCKIVDIDGDEANGRKIVPF